MFKKCLCVILNVTLFMGCSSRTPIESLMNSSAATDDKLMEATVNGRRDAESDYRSGAGCLLGAGCGVLGIGVSYAYKSEIPSHRLLQLEGKSDRYIQVYTEEYVNYIRNRRAKESVAGLVVGIAIVIVGALYFSPFV